jgi:hypothetical protein
LPQKFDQDQKNTRRAASRSRLARDARNVHVQRYVSTGDGDPKEAEKKAWQRNFREARNTGLIGGETVGGQELIWIAAS